MKTGSMRCWHLFLGATKHWMKSFSWQEDERTMAGMRVGTGNGRRTYARSKNALPGGIVPPVGRPPATVDDKTSVSWSWLRKLEN